MTRFMQKGAALKLALGLLCAGLMSQAATAQDGVANLRGDDLGVRAAIGFTVPFGQMGPKSQQRKARFAAGFAVERNWINPRTALRERSQVNLIDFGVYETLEPSFQLSGQELYGPIFDPLYRADEDAEPTPTGLEAPIKRPSSGSAAPLILMGLVGVGGLLVLINESEDQLEDCLESIFGLNEC